MEKTSGVEKTSGAPDQAAADAAVPGAAAGTAALSAELSGLLIDVQRLVRRTLRRAAPTPRLRGAQVELLRLVAASPGLRVSAAARELRLAGNSVSTLVNQLVKAGMLRRETDPQDRRAALLHVTPAASARLDAWTERRGELFRDQVARLSDDDRAALVDALPALRRLAGALHEEADSP